MTELSLQGYMGSKIEYHRRNMSWTLHTAASRTFATSDRGAKTFALGKTIWKIENENPGCGWGSLAKRPLKLTGKYS